MEAATVFLRLISVWRENCFILVIKLERNLPLALPSALSSLQTYSNLTSTLCRKSISWNVAKRWKNGRVALKLFLKQSKTQPLWKINSNLSPLSRFDFMRHSCLCDPSSPHAWHQFIDLQDTRVTASSGFTINLFDRLHSFSLGWEPWQMKCHMWCSCEKLSHVQHLCYCCTNAV